MCVARGAVVTRARSRHILVRLLKFFCFAVANCEVGTLHFLRQEI